MPFSAQKCKKAQSEYNGEIHYLYKGGLALKPQSFFLSISMTFFVLIGFLVFTPTREVFAQCKTPSTCKTCHEVQSQYPVNTRGDWHTDHIIIDSCAECHGGSRMAPDMATAHVGTTKDLKLMAGNCVACHCDDLEDRFAPYAVQKNITDLSFLKDAENMAVSASSSPFNNGFLAPAPFGVTAPLEPEVETEPSTPLNTNNNSSANLAAGLLLAAVTVTGGGLVIKNERKLQNKQTNSSFLNWLWIRFREENWSPYIAGVGLGIVGILAVVVANHLMTASGGIAVTASALVHRLAPQTIEKNIYFRFVMPPAFDWEVLILIGMFVGGFLASLSSGTFKIRWNQDPVWVKIFGTSRLKRFLIGFISAVIIQYGASIAGGCTSGLAISGGMLLAPSAFLFMAGMFISGIITAIIVFRRRY